MAERANLVFHNKVIDRTDIKRFISRLIDHFGMAYTSHILDQVKTLGFQQATATSISLGIDDLLTIPSKRWLVQDAEEQRFILEKHHHYGNVHAVEKLRQSIEIWYATKPLNPVHIMSFSGARENASQVYQLVGMRGLMSDPQGQMIDLPIQSNLREGLSLTEYIISCYGARKGVVDTAVRTSDAGYLTRRLVEVVQHIVVRRTDCGTARGIYVNNIYMGIRCIAIRNQDIGIGLVNRFITFRRQPISIRTPFTCRSTSWICRLCYGRSPTHGDLVELGEAVGIIAGQSIGEPGTQLTLRTFHTGGVFTAQGDLVHPTRTRHGHPNQDMIHNVTIPPKSLILVQNDQYVESEQVIAEIRAGAYTLNFKERVRKHIYSDSEGEMHWSTDVYHAPEFTYSNIHLLPKTSHCWILSGGSCRSSIAPFSLHKDQDQISVHSPSVERRNISSPSLNNDQVKHKFFSSDLPGKKESAISDYSELNRIICTGYCNRIYPAIPHENSDLLAKRRRNRFIIPLQSIQEREKELMPCSGISIEIPIGIFRRNSIFAYFDAEETSSRGWREQKKMELQILSGDRYFPGETDKISRHSGILISPGTIKTEAKKAKNWIYVQRITPTKKNSFVLVRPVIIYEMADSINLETLFPQDLLQEKDNLKLRVVNYILCGNGKLIRGISDTSIQLVRTCLVLIWDQDKKGFSVEEAHPSFLSSHSPTENC
ncbi:hypothetical protein K2173_010160 (mitochondrion) [Erythroxylum novogranatense]|uniref:DNA-directed RNA polymerase n=1 Tax=Erythroxylum novogranatense TaxID=1862640 RepID=A0AAV8S4A5_9ROSI|nr:hypothetical protein K2173_010160 [Erythroxylum novogranatense]